jgi:hypothetical protein
MREPHVLNAVGSWHCFRDYWPNAWKRFLLESYGLRQNSGTLMVFHFFFLLFSLISAFKSESSCCLFSGKMFSRKWRKINLLYEWMNWRRLFSNRRLVWEAKEGRRRRCWKREDWNRYRLAGSGYWRRLTETELIALCNVLLLLENPVHRSVLARIQPLLLLLTDASFCFLLAFFNAVKL